MEFQSKTKVMEKYTYSEIELHNTKDDCLLSIHGKVYDVTTFLEDHPGGDHVILQAAASGDATDAFDEIQHNPIAYTLMDKYQIGVVDGYVKPDKSVKKAKRFQENLKSSTGPAEYQLLHLACFSLLCGSVLLYFHFKG